MSQIPLNQCACARHPEADAQRDDEARQITTDRAYRQIAVLDVIFLGDTR